MNHGTEDLVQPFQVEEAGVRGRLVRLGRTVRDALDRHAYPAPVRTLLAETMALAVVLASAIKFKGIFTLQTQGDGPVGMMVADVTADGAVRGYARVDEARLAAADPLSAPVPRLLGTGHLAFTVDQGPETERYQGIVALEGATMTECAQAYFRQSEQLETAILLAADADRAAGLMIQRLPPKGSDAVVEQAEEDWRRSVILMSAATREELLDASLAPGDLLYRLYHVDGVRLFRPRAVRHQCRCSRRKVIATLKAFPKAEIMSMADRGRIDVRCEFCNAEYTFDATGLDRLFGQ